MEINLDSDVIKILLEKRSWNKSVPPTINKKFVIKNENTVERVVLYYYRYENLRLDNAYNSLINAGFDSYPVNNNNDYKELEDLLVNQYGYNEISDDSFDNWFQNYIDKFLPTLFLDIPLAAKYWKLYDNIFNKVAFIENVNGGYTYISWSITD